MSPQIVFKHQILLALLEKKTMNISNKYNTCPPPVSDSIGVFADL